MAALPTNLAYIDRSRLPSEDELIARARAEGRSIAYLAGAALEEKRVQAWALNGMVRAGLDPKGPSPETLTVAQLAEDYLSNHAEAHKRPASVADDRSMLKRIILPALGARRVKDIQTTDIEALHNSLKAKPYQANRVRSLLSKLFNRATPRLRSDNPVRGTKPFNEEKRKRWLNDEEMTRLWAVLDAEPNQLQARAIKLLVYTGARKGELLAARWADIDLERGVWVKPSAHTKQKQEHRVPLSSAAVELLAVMQEEAKGPYVFPGRDGEPLKDVKALWERVRKLTGVEWARIHDLRHTAASQLVSAGVSLPIVGAILGHTQPSTTARYAHVADKPPA
jgi:integrase